MVYGPDEQSAHELPCVPNARWVFLGLEHDGASHEPSERISRRCTTIESLTITGNRGEGKSNRVYKSPCTFDFETQTYMVDDEAELWGGSEAPYYREIRVASEVTWDPRGWNIGVE